MAEKSAETFEAPHDCFIATGFSIGRCPCGCGVLKLVGFDENEIARAIVCITPEQLAECAVELGVLPHRH